MERKKNDEKAGRERKEMSNEEKNKAGYTAIPVACGWAGAVFEVT